MHTPCQHRWIAVHRDASKHRRCSAGAGRAYFDAAMDMGHVFADMNLVVAASRTTAYTEINPARSQRRAEHESLIHRAARRRSRSRAPVRPGDARPAPHRGGVHARGHLRAGRALRVRDVRPDAAAGAGAALGTGRASRGTGRASWCRAPHRRHVLRSRWHTRRERGFGPGPGRRHRAGLVRLRSRRFHRAGDADGFVCHGANARLLRRLLVLRARTRLGRPARLVEEGFR